MRGRGETPFYLFYLILKIFNISTVAFHNFLSYKGTMVESAVGCLNIFESIEQKGEKRLI